LLSLPLSLLLVSLLGGLLLGGFPLPDLLLCCCAAVSYEGVANANQILMGEGGTAIVTSDILPYY